MIQRLVDNTILGLYTLMLQLAVIFLRMLDWRPKAQRAGIREQER